MPASYDPYEAYVPNGLQFKLVRRFMAEIAEDRCYIPSIQLEDDAVIFTIGPIESYLAEISFCWLDEEDPADLDLLGKPLPQLLEVSYHLTQTAYWPTEQRCFTILDIIYRVLDDHQGSPGELVVHHYAKPTFVLSEEEKREGYEDHFGPSSLYPALVALSRTLEGALLRDGNLSRIINGLKEYADIFHFNVVFDGPDTWEYCDPAISETH